MATEEQYRQAKQLMESGDNENEQINADKLYLKPDEITQVYEIENITDGIELLPLNNEEDEDDDNTVYVELNEYNQLKIYLKRIDYYEKAVDLLKQENNITKKDHKLLAEIYEKMSALASKLVYFYYRYKLGEPAEFLYRDKLREWDLASLDAKKQSIEYSDQADDSIKSQIVDHIKRLNEKHSGDADYCNYLNKAGFETLELMSDDAKKDPKMRTMLLEFYVNYEYGMKNYLLDTDKLDWNDNIHKETLEKIMSFDEYSQVCDTKEIKYHCQSLAKIYFNSENEFSKAKEYYIKSTGDVTSYETIGDLYFNKKHYKDAKDFYEMRDQAGRLDAFSKNRLQNKIQKCETLESTTAPIIAHQWQNVINQSNKNNENNENKRDSETMSCVTDGKENEAKNNKRMCHDK